MLIIISVRIVLILSISVILIVYHFHNSDMINGSINAYHLEYQWFKKSNKNNQSQIKPLTESDFTFKGLYLLQEVDEQGLTRKFGEPPSIYPGEAHDKNIYRYTGFEIETCWTLFLECIISIELTGRGPTTSRGLRVGDSEEKLLKTYAPLEFYSDSGDVDYDGHYICYLKDSRGEDQYAMFFKILKHKIKAIYMCII